MAVSEFVGLGKRKSAIAKVRIKPGSGNIDINKMTPEKYFDNPISIQLIKQPLDITKSGNQYDILIRVKGSGKKSQAGACRLGISRALSQADENLKISLRKAGLLTCDSRRVERKKYGKKKARKSFQFSKR